MLYLLINVEEKQKEIEQRLTQLKRNYCICFISLEEKEAEATTRLSNYLWLINADQKQEEFNRERDRMLS